ncbi:PREDICTED: early light-induced protein 1, chloroplastic-like [Populus euphratica]|uniref:Early light-induced protein 1, chloroplastic-like n=1 Tax=Populus euphratica TaxID=75702 RepID=A0AAJ6XQ46_POPEU|nr:PREDICTED: early light-induced protein 1, chloroplastic-like [Populus euphratica]
MATSTVMQTVLATPVPSSLVKNRSGVSNLFSATYVPRLRGSASKRVQCQAKLDDQKKSAGLSSTPKPKVSTKFADLLAFSGPAPERINGRLAMIGFVAAMAVELSKGQDLFSQISNGGVSWFVGTSILLSVASLIPLFKGISAESKSEGVMTSDAEMWNGRFAMLGLVALACTEYVSGGTLL